jgi:hypothetical protein
MDQFGVQLDLEIELLENFKMSTKLNVILIFGGKSGEHVSPNASNLVFNALDPEKYNIFQVGITREGRWTMLKMRWKPSGTIIAEPE